MALNARSLFDFCVRSRDGGTQHATPATIAVTGTVVRAVLGHDDTPLVWLEADSRGTCRVECHCLSDEVLLKAKPGSEVTLEGFCRGLEDSVTAVLDRCELLAVAGRPAFAGKARTRRKQGAPEGVSRALRCSFCGRHQAEVNRLVTIGGRSICDRCASEYSARLRSGVDLAKPSAGRGEPPLTASTTQSSGVLGREDDKTPPPAPDPGCKRARRFLCRIKRALTARLRQWSEPEPIVG